MHVVGALIVVAWCWAAGRLLVRPASLAFATGCAIVSMVVFALGMLGIATPGVFGIAAALTVAALAWREPAALRPSIRRPGNPAAYVAVAIFLAFGAIYAAWAAAPEMSPDGAGYHLGVIREFFNAHRMFPVTWNMFSMLSQGMEMLFWPAYAFGRHSAAALVHFATLIALAGAMIAYGRRIGRPWTGAAAALLVFVSPVVGIDAASAYVDVGLALACFATFASVELWSEEISVHQRSSAAIKSLREDERLLWAIGLVAGFCFAIKYTGGVAIPYAAALVYWRTRRIRPALIVLAAAAIVALPWAIRNAVWFHDPLAPFFVGMFPNPYVRASIEEAYRYNMRHYGGQGVGWSTPLDLAIGGRLLGITGPTFLLAPLGLLALRTPQGRRVWLAAAVFGFSYFTNIGTRFTIPALPFLALALCMAVQNWKPALAALVIIQAVACWPSVVARYAVPGTWRIDGIPWRAALRIEPETAYLERRYAPWYQVTQMIQRELPSGATVYTAMPLPYSYTDRRFWLNYQAEAPNQVEDLLKSALADPSKRLSAVAAVRRIGPRYLLIHDDEPLGPAIASNPVAWGLKPCGQVAPMRLYEIAIDLAAQRRNNQE